MKKIFALALAALMTAGMTTVAFAADDAYLQFGTKGQVVVDMNDDGKFLGDGKDEVADFTDGKVDLSKVPGGKKIAIVLKSSKGGYITDKEDIKSYKVKTEWSVGDLDEKAAIELVKFDSGYLYAVTFTLPEGAETKYQDLAGEVSIYKNSSDLKKDSDKVGITLNFGAEYGYKTEDYDAVADWDKVEVVDFDDVEGEETLTFGDDFEFEVDVTGQGKLNLAYNTKYNKDFAYDYDDANIDFINFEGEPTTNRTGTLYIYADEDSYIYEVTSKGAKKINGAYYDDDEEAWVIRTRNLTSYAISDKKLKTVDQMNNGSSSSSSSKPGSNSGSGSNNGKPNPDTGR